jgi:hypothetical protein
VSAVSAVGVARQVGTDPIEQVSATLFARRRRESEKRKVAAVSAAAAAATAPTASPTPPRSRDRPPSSLSWSFLIFITLARFALRISDLHAIMWQMRCSFRIERAPELWRCLVGWFALQQRGRESERERERVRPSDRAEIADQDLELSSFELFASLEKGERAAPAAPQSTGTGWSSQLARPRKRTRRLAPAAATTSSSPRLCSSTLPPFPLFRSAIGSEPERIVQSRSDRSDRSSPRRESLCVYTACPRLLPSLPHYQRRHQTVRINRCDMIEPVSIAIAIRSPIAVLRAITHATAHRQRRMTTRINLLDRTDRSSFPRFVWSRRIAREGSDKSGRCRFEASPAVEVRYRGVMRHNACRGRASGPCPPFNPPLKFREKGRERERERERGLIDTRVARMCVSVATNRMRLTDVSP